MDSTDATAATGTAVGSEAAAPVQDVDVPMSEEQNQAADADDNDDPVEGTPGTPSAAAATASSSKGPGPGDAAKCVKCMKRYGKSSKCTAE